MEDFFACVNEVLDLHGVKKLHLIGHSAGGYYAQVYAQNYPDSTTLLVDTYDTIQSGVPNAIRIAKEVLEPMGKRLKGVRIDSQIKRNNFLTLHMKAISKFFFKKAAEGMTSNFDSQFKEMMKTISEKERECIGKNYDMVKNAIIDAVKNDGVGIYYDAYALCKKRDNVCISKSIPIYIWNGSKDNTTPVTYAEYLAKKYSATRTHIIDGVGHMMYLMYWKDIVFETFEKSNL